MVGRRQVLTCHHVIDNGLQVFVEIFDNWMPMQVVKSDPSADLALLQSDQDIPILPVNIASSDLSSGHIVSSWFGAGPATVSGRYITGRYQCRSGYSGSGMYHNDELVSILCVGVLNPQSPSVGMTSEGPTTRVIRAFLGMDAWGASRPEPTPPIPTPDNPPDNPPTNADPPQFHITRTQWRQVNQKIDNLSNTTNSLSQEIIGVRQDVDTLKSQVSTINNNFNLLVQSITEYKEQQEHQEKSDAVSNQDIIDAILSLSDEDKKVLGELLISNVKLEAHLRDRDGNILIDNNGKPLIQKFGLGDPLKLDLIPIGEYPK